MPILVGGQNFSFPTLFDSYRELLLKTDKSLNLMTGIPNRAAFDALFCGKEQCKKIKYWSGPSKSTRKGRNFKKSPIISFQQY